MGLLLLNTVAEFSTIGELQPTKSEQTGYFGYVSEVHGNRTTLEKVLDIPPHHSTYQGNDAKSRQPNGSLVSKMNDEYIRARTAPSDMCTR